MKRFGRYEILEELGHGAMGVVYKARDPELDRLVALKVIRSGELDAAALRQRGERFQREGRAAARLTHPNIVTVYDVGEERGHAFLVMEYLEGQPLDQLLRQRGTLPLDQVITIGEQVAHALDYAHRSGIVHRDVKPANILLTSDGVVKVTDFGIARITGETFTQLGQAVGTPSYMSPEQVAGLKVDGRSDLFSMGAVLYELITGDKAFPGDTLSTINYRILNEDPVPLRRLNPAYPAALDSCLKKALAKDPARRYARTTDLARDLRAAMEGAAAPADPPADSTIDETAATQARPAPPARPPRRANWTWIATGGLALAGLALALTLWLRPPQAPPVSPATPAPATTPAVPPAKAPDDQAAKAKAAAEEEARKKALADEATRKAADAKAAEDRKKQEEAAARQQAEEAAKAKAAAEQLAAERKRLDEEKARLAQQQAALAADQKKAAEDAARQKAAADEATRKAADAKAAEDRKRQEEAEARRKAEEEARRTPRAGTIQQRGRDNAEMAFIPAGAFTMGDTHGDGATDEKPTHPVSVAAFWLDKTEVTNAQFARFVQAGHSAQGNWQQYSSGKDQHPVVQVTWHDALAYCRWAGKRLPTEAEWEHAARGTDGRKYPWGSQWDENRARYSGNRGSQTTAPVGSYPSGASPFGILDLAGNVLEWTTSLYRPYPYSVTDGREDLYASGYRVDRGGSWSSDPGSLRSASRYWDVPASRNGNLGFRCAQGVQ